MNEINELAAALSKAQAVMPAAKMNATNPFLKNRYADLGSVIEASRKPLADNGLSVTQLVTGDESRVTVETILMHSTGQSISSRMSLALGENKNAAQAAGSLITYMRRYSLSAMLGIYADEDADGNEPKQAPAKVEAPVKQEPLSSPATSMSPETAKNIVSTSTGKKYDDLETPDLANRANALSKAIKAGTHTGDELEEKKYKLDAIKTIMAERNK